MISVEIEFVKINVLLHKTSLLENECGTLPKDFYPYSSDILNYVLKFWFNPFWPVLTIIKSTPNFEGF